jgi:hypothetical protein
MVYTTKFHKIGMFKRFSLSGITYLRVGRKYYQNVTTGAVLAIASLGTAVIQVTDDYKWTTT